MPKSYRIRTQVGVDKKIDVDLSQDFEFLEILSLKLSQSELYVRQCSDYGVVVGRVSINNGFGLPNVKLSIFIPVTQEDELNPIISSIYPYKTVDDINEDGYKYNLLPYKPSYPGHSATGSFPDLEDVLINPTAIEIYDKYYKFTVTTNDSGDFMIFGVPVGSQTLVMNVDLSDIGPFSLSPQDLIRLGIATDSQVNGTRFKTSENINILPQIITISKDIIVEPLWGEQDLCQSSITRTDFDLTNEVQVEIKPTAIFMGSLISTPETQAQKKSCKIKKQVGNQCSLISGPGQIKSIRQTIRQDQDGRPILEEFEFENNGNVIDENGAWLLDVPMNLDYVITNEFGDQIFSNDEKMGIPTKAKYRFKIKWNQSPDLGTPYKRGYFLVPNIKEYGWITSDKDPVYLDPNLPNPTTYSINLSTNQTSNITTIPISQNCVVLIRSLSNVSDYSFILNGVVQTRKNNISVKIGDNLQVNIVGDPPNSNPYVASFIIEYQSINKYQLESSYSFSLSWDDYNNPSEAINCQDTFYEMKYNKVYTVSQLIDQYRKGFSNPKFLGIKNITDETCESTANPFPTNDAQYKSSILYLLFSLILLIFRPTLFILLIVSHIVSFLLKYLFPLLIPSILIVFLLVIGICNLINGVIGLFGGKKLNCPDFGDLSNLFDTIKNLWKKLIIRLPNLTYPDCDICNCIDEDAQNYADDPYASQIKNTPSGNLFDFTSFNAYKNIQTSTGNYLCCPTDDDCNTTNWNDDGEECNNKVVAIQASVAGVGSPDYAYGGTNVIDPDSSVFPVEGWVSTSLPIAERINLFNAKSKYFNDANAGEGVNRIRVTFNPVNNPITQESKCHTDNVIMIVVKKDQLNNFKAGQLLSLQDPNLSKDLNYINSVTATTSTGLTSVQVQYANPITPSFVNKIQNYVLNITGETNTSAKFPMDLEYYQIITATTLNTIKDYTNPSGNNSFFNKVFRQPSTINKIRVTSQPLVFVKYWDIDEYIALPNNDAPKFPYEFIEDWKDLAVLILVRGVDPNTPKFEIEYGLGKLFGKSETHIRVKGLYHPNIPIQNSYNCVRHSQVTGNTDTDNLSQYLYFPSFNNFKIQQANFSAFSTDLHQYYVNLDSTTFGDIPVYLPGFIDNDKDKYKCGRGITTDQSLNVIIENDEISTNDEMNDWVYTPNQIGTTWTNTGNPRKPNSQYQGFGYLKNEKVEGCSYAHLSYWGINERVKQRAYGAQGIYVSKKYSSKIRLKFSYDSQSRYIMRSDRLPTSTYEFKIGDNHIALQQNLGLSFYLFSDEGDLTQLPYIGGGGYSSDDNGDNITGATEPSFVNNVLTSFSCGEENSTLVPFGCYKFDQAQNTIVLDTPECLTKNPGKVEYFKNNCYQMVTKPIVSLIVDFGSLLEWISRTKIMFGLCQGVFSHLFTNSWINGTLFAFSFRNLRLFDKNNQPFNRTCEDTLYFHRPSNNFYYRSSPYNLNVNKFIGKDAPKPLLGKYFGGNMKNLLFPTTIMDLGPRDEISKFLSQSLSQDYEGYIMNRFDSTTFNDIDEILNLFIISRLANTTFLQQFFNTGGADIFSYFTREKKVTSYYASPYHFNVRNKNMVDADYAQLISINSELGIVPFDTETYPSDPNTTQQESIYFNGSNQSSGAIVGIFFSSNTQLRDFITPKRIVYTDTLPVNKTNCSFGKLSVSDQEVPFYQWGIQNTESIIFGNQRNHWYTVGVDGLDSFHKMRYQSLDRLLPQSRFFRTKNQNQTSFYKGYIYSVYSNGIINASSNNAQFNTITPPPTVVENVITAGNPFYFYFGLNRGASSMDRFIQKWVDTDELVG